MRLWTIQDEAAFQRFENESVLRADEQYLFVKPDDGTFYQCYLWMAEQMKRRIGLPPAGVRFPIWAWYWWLGERHKKPDMRYAAHAMRGDHIVRITADIPNEKVLLSNFDAYFYPFSGVYLPESEPDAARFEQAYTDAGFLYRDLTDANVRCSEMNVFREEIKQSWNRIFDLNRCDANWLYGRASEACIQATMWEIRKEWVTRVEWFVAR